MQTTLTSQSLASTLRLSIEKSEGVGPQKPTPSESRADEYPMIANKITEDGEAVKRPLFALPRGNSSYPECAKLLFSICGQSKTIFRKGDVFCELLHNPFEMRPLTPCNFIARVDKFVRIYTMTTTERKFTKLNELEARSLLGTDEARCYIPEIKIVTNAPVLYMQGGKLFQANVGYNNTRGVYVKEGVGDVPIVPPAKAKAALLDLLSEFNFATPEI